MTAGETTERTVEAPISGVVVSYNDARRLDECLQALSFCQELVLVDLGSEDESVEIGRARGARIVDHPWVPVVEEVRAFAVEQAAHDWIAFMDPDMVFPSQLVEEVRRIVSDSSAQTIIAIPYRNYFRGKPVRYGRWGGHAVYPAVFHRAAFDLTSDVHRGFAAREGALWNVLNVPPTDEIVHHWVESRADMHARARRYAALEGEARHRRGERFTWRHLILGVPRAFASSLIKQRGYRDGVRGVSLSYYSARLTAVFLLALRKVERSSHGVVDLADEGT